MIRPALVILAGSSRYILCSLVALSIAACSPGSEQGGGGLDAAFDTNSGGDSSSNGDVSADATNDSAETQDTSVDAPDGANPFPTSSVKSCTNDDVVLQSVFGSFDITYIALAAKWSTGCRDEVAVINSDVIPNVDVTRVKVIQLLLENNPGEAPPTDLCQTWTDDLAPDFEIMSDVDQMVVASYFGGVVPSTLPQHILVDRSGNIVYSLVGEIPSTMAQIINQWLP